MRTLAALALALALALGGTNLVGGPSAALGSNDDADLIIAWLTLNHDVVADMNFEEKSEQYAGGASMALIGSDDYPDGCAMLITQTSAASALWGAYWLQESLVNSMGVDNFSTAALQALGNMKATAEAFERDSQPGSTVYERCAAA